MSLSSLVVFVVVLAVLLAVSNAAVLSGNLCAISYSLAGNIDYPWSTATSINFQYDNTPVGVNGTAVTILSGSGTRTYTNKFGQSFSTPLTVTGPNVDYSDNLLYLNGQVLDGDGITYNLSTPVQFPGHGPLAPVQLINLYYSANSGEYIEQNAFRLDPAGQAFLSNIANFTNVTIIPSNINALSVQYAACRAPININNGLRTRLLPNTITSQPLFTYGYSISDGNWTVSASLLLNATTPFPVGVDQLGNQYQVIANISGTRTYTNATYSLTSTVTGLSSAVYANDDEFFFPYAFLQAAPAVYTANTAPFLDYDGLEYGINPPAPKDGGSSTTLYSAVSPYYYTSLTEVVLREGSQQDYPLSTLQKQSLVL